MIQNKAKKFLLLGCLASALFELLFLKFGSRTTSRRDFKTHGLQGEIQTLQAPQNSPVKRLFSEV